MYFNFNLSGKQETLLKEKYETYVNSILDDDELLQEAFKEAFKGRLKSATTEIIQSQEFKSRIMAKLIPFTYEKFGIEEQAK